MRVYKGRTTRELGIYAPGVIVVGISALAFMSGAFGTGLLVGIVAVPLILLGLALDIKMSRAWYHSPEGAIQEFLSYRRLKRKLPWGHREAVGETNDVRSIEASGSVKRRDGSHAALIRVKGMNTTHLSATEIDALVQRYTNEIEGEIASEDRWWATYSTTRPATADTLADLRQERGDDFDNNLSDEQRELMRQSAEWLREQDRKHDANDWHHYIVIEATPSEAAVDPNSIGARVNRTSSHLPSFIPFFGSDDPEEDEEPDEEQEEQEEAADHQVGALLTKRVGKIERAIDGIGELDASRASPGEHVEVLRTYYTSQNRRKSDEEPKMLNLFERKWDVDGFLFSVIRFLYSSDIDQSRAFATFLLSTFPLSSS